MSWKLSVSSKQAVLGWEAEAVRLRRFLDVITEQVAAQHDRPLRWRNESMTVEQWNDPAAITTEVLSERLRSEDGTTLTPGGDSTGTVQGYLGDHTDTFVHSMWSVGGGHDWQFTANQDFNTADDEPNDGLAKPLNGYPVEWLVDLVRQTAQSVDADEARIHTMGTFKAMKRAKVPREIRRILGAVTLAPNGLRDDATLPETVTVHPGIDTKPDSVILAADLDSVVNDPAAVIENLLAVHAAITPDSAV